MFITNLLLDELSESERAELERRVEMFENAWRSGERPRPGDHLPPSGLLRRALLPELLHADLECRLASGEPVSTRTYLRDFPELADDPATVVELLRAEDELTPPAAAAPEGGPRRVGRFELLEELGSGSSGTVYRAHDPELRRVVALKVPRLGGLTGTAEADRFLREARSVAGLRHPGLVALYDAGRVDHLCYLVSEFVPGTTLAQELCSGPMPPRRAAELTAAVADAMHHAHAAGVVHRDVKPSNILLDGNGVPRLTDFGLARLAVGEQSLTDTGALLGTPAYMSPEQARGEGHRVDARADVYSLGVVLYECLTGQRPFADSGQMLLQRILEEDPISPRRLRRQVPRDLERVCLKGMSKEPPGRYATAAEMADDLRRYLAGEPVRARPVGPLRRTLRWTRRKPVLASLTAGLVLSVAVGFVLVLDGWRRAEARAAEARAQRRTAEVTFRQAHEAVQELGRLSGDPRLQGPEMEPLRRQLRGRAVDYFRRFVEQRGSDPSLKYELATAYYQLARLSRVHGGGADETLALLGRAETVAAEGRSAAPGDRRWADVLARVHKSAADIHGARSEPGEWLRRLEAARVLVEELEQTQGDETSLAILSAGVWRGIARCHLTHGSPQAAVAALHQQRQRCEAMTRRLPHSVYWLTRLGECYRELAEVERDPRWAEESFAAYQRATRLVDHPESSVADETRWEETLEGYLALGNAQLRLAKPTDGLRSLQEAVSLAERLVAAPGSGPRMRAIAGRAYTDKGQALMSLDRCDEALEALARGRRPCQDLCKWFPAEEPYLRALGVILHDEGKCYQRTARPAEALARYREALQLRERLHALNPKLSQYRLDLGATAYHAAQVLEELGRHDEALAEYRRAVTEMRASWDRGAKSRRNRGWLEDRYRALATILRKLGRADEAATVEAEARGL